MAEASRPLLTVLVVIFRMARQAENTIYSLSPSHQREVSADDYEIVVVENESDDLLGATRAETLGSNVRYFLRQEAGVSPAPAVNFGRAQSRGRWLCLLVDGARMVTPRVVAYALAAFRMEPRATVVVPGYHLGEAEQHENPVHEVDAEQALLESIDWKSQGYRLFDVSCYSGGNRRGVFHPFMECNCVASPTDAFDAIGGADERFDLPGGGSVNLAIYRKLALRADAPLIVLPGEGSFHQFHGGVTTARVTGREEMLKEHREQLARLLGEPFQAPRREPVLLGAVTSHAQRFLEMSCQKGANRFDRFRKSGEVAWADDPSPIE